MNRTIALGASFLLLISPFFVSAATVQEMQAQLQVLLAQIAQLQAQLAQVQPGGQLAVQPTAPVSNAQDSHAIAHRGKNGQSFTHHCPQNVAASAVWGSVWYSDDSSICNAAIHAGVISRASGGAVTITIQPGQGSYSGTSNNGVVTLSWGAWPGSFTVNGVTPPAIQTPSMPETPAASPAIPASANTTAESLRPRVGEVFRYVCPAHVVSASVWGTGIFTDDSSICNAAIHVGVIQRETGGVVAISIHYGMDSYTASTKNGVTTQSWGAWPGSFIVHK